MPLIRAVLVPLHRLPGSAKTMAISGPVLIVGARLAAFLCAGLPVTRCREGEGSPMVVSGTECGFMDGARATHERYLETLSRPWSAHA